METVEILVVACRWGCCGEQTEHRIFRAVGLFRMILLMVDTVPRVNSNVSCGPLVIIMYQTNVVIHRL